MRECVKRAKVLEGRRLSSSGVEALLRVREGAREGAVRRARCRHANDFFAWSQQRLSEARRAPRPALAEFKLACEKFYKRDPAACADVLHQDRTVDAGDW